MIRLIFELVAIPILAIILLASGVNILLIFVLVVVWLTRAIQQFRYTKAKKEYMQEKGYSENPVTSARKLTKKLLENGFQGVAGIAVAALGEYKAQPEWSEAISQYNRLAPKVSSGGLGTSNAWVNILGGYFLQKFAESQNDKMQMLIVSLNDGKYYFAPVSGGGLKEFGQEAQQAGVTIKGNLDAEHRSFSLTK